MIGGTLGILSAFGCGTWMTEETKSVTSGGAFPTIQERLSQRVVTRTLVATDGTQYVVRVTAGGGERTVHVDQRTKLDPVTSGEMVRIYITDEGHATTLQRVID
jgi:hypothetical protein